MFTPSVSAIFFYETDLILQINQDMAIITHDNFRSLVLSYILLGMATSTKKKPSILSNDRVLFTLTGYRLFMCFSQAIPVTTAIYINQMHSASCCLQAQIMSEKPRGGFGLQV